MSAPASRTASRGDGAPLQLLDLPDELLLHVALQCSDVCDVSHLARTCTMLHTLVRETDHFWQQMLARHFDVPLDSGTAAAAAAAASSYSSAAVLSPYAEFRELSSRMEWAWPASSQGHMSYTTAATEQQQQQMQLQQRNVVYLRADVQSYTGSGTRSAYTARPLAPHGLTAFCVRIDMPAINLYHLGFVACDRDVDDERWNGQYPPEGTLRAFVHDACARGQFFPPSTTNSTAAGVHSTNKPPFVPEAWGRAPGREGKADQFGWTSKQAVYMVLDADRGRVYYALGEPVVFCVAFDDARLANVRNLRVFVSLVNEKAWASIERVRVTDAIRAELRATDVAFAATK